MADKSQLIGQIRFAIDQLSERNAFHEWEDLCRHLARERICSNILPATGPVQSGGDQGRDFETFRTFLYGSSLQQRSFVGLVSDKMIAFACTLEKTVPAKVRRDVKTIVSSGSTIEYVYVCSAKGVPVAKRHELQEWARDVYGISLELFDGAAISELLSDRDLFWIAERYLQIPAELMPTQPPGDDRDKWYVNILEKWRRATRPAQTYADFSEIRSAARIAQGEFIYDHTGCPLSHYEYPETPFWIELLDAIADDTMILPELRRRALYEVSVIRLRGLGSLIGQEDRLRAYFADIPQLNNSADLEDADVLLTYVFGACHREKCRLHINEVNAWSDELDKCMHRCLQEAEKDSKINERCRLLEILGHRSLFQYLRDQKIGLTTTFRYWNKVAQLAVHAPLFPLEQFSDRLVRYACYIGSHPDYGRLTQAVDSLLAERFGQFKVAEKCLERAQAFRDAGDLNRAISQLHKAKLDWFAEETFGKSLSALRWLSDAYMEQGLFFAAKYHALAAAYMALHSHNIHIKHLIACRLEQASSCDYAMGAWHGFLELAECTASIYPHFAHDPEEDFNTPNGVLRLLLHHVGLLPVITKILHPELHAFVWDRCAHITQLLNMEDVFQSLQPVAEKAWDNKGSEELLQSLEENIAGPPWSDADTIRFSQWKAHGVVWIVQWDNQYEINLVAEGFLAILQILLSDLAGYDLCLMRSTLTIRLIIAQDDIGCEFRDIGGFETHFGASNNERSVDVTLPSYDDFRRGRISTNDLQAGALGVASSLLEHLSLLSAEKFQTLLNERFQEGLINKLFTAANFTMCMSQFIGRDDFGISERSTHHAVQLPRQFSSRMPESLPWFDGPGPGYDRASIDKHIRNRYERFSAPLQHIIPCLVLEPAFQTTLAQLRADGWKDWHILAAIYQVTINYHYHQQQIHPTNQKTEEAAFKRIANHIEAENMPSIPLDEYSEHELRAQFKLYQCAFAKTYHLELHQLSPDMAALDDFLSARYNFWTDDVDHDDPFRYPPKDE